MQRMFSNKALRQLIVPLVIEQALAVLVGMMDTMMVASVSEAAMSGVSQLQRARDRGIVGLALVHGALSGLADIFRGVKVRLAHAEAHHVHALRAQSLCAAVDGEGDGRGDLQAAI